MAMEESKVTKMKTFIIEEKFVGYADITIEAETETKQSHSTIVDIIPIVNMTWMICFMTLSFAISERRQINDNKLPEMDRAITQCPHQSQNTYPQS